MFTFLRRGLLAGAATALTLGGVALSASAATPACTAVAGAGCGSWNAEVPNQPDLDVYGGGATVGNAIIMFTRTNHDKAEDFRIQLVSALSVSKYAVTGVHTFAVGQALGGTDAVRIQYAPNGTFSGLCISTVNPIGFTAVQLRPCDTVANEFNPFQTFRSAAASGDGTFVSFREVINDHALTDPRENGSIGRVGHRVHVITANWVGTSGQLWGQNGA